MKKYKVTPSRLKGSIAIPPSKSHTMRAILFGSLANGKSIIRHYLPSPDTEYMIQACRLLGAHITVAHDHLVIEGIQGAIKHVEDVINAGNSGLILRFLAGIAALSPSYVVITGDDSIRHRRPMQPMLDALCHLGAFAVSARDDGFAPLIIRGPLKGGRTHVLGTDSQPVSSLLIACSLADGPSEITVRNPGEKPWVQVTLDWLQRLGVQCTNENYERYQLQGGARFEAFEYAVPGDWSTAAYPIASALVTQSALTIENADYADPQGDKELVNVLKKMGASIEIDQHSKRISVKSGSKLRGITVDINPLIDALPILAVIACFAEGETRIINASIARHKECDRLKAISTELIKMGGIVQEHEDGLVIQGNALKGACLNSHGDHRMAMALSVAALGANGVSQIENVDCVSKTFPHFAKSLRELKAEIVEYAH